MFPSEEPFFHFVVSIVKAIFIFLNIIFFCSMTNMVLKSLQRGGCIFSLSLSLLFFFLRLAWIQGWYSIRLMCKTCTECGAVNLHGVWTKDVVADYLACVAAG